MIDLTKAPEKGVIYALYIDKVLFRGYEDLREVSSYIQIDHLLELHLFDENKELRYIKTRRGDFICHEIKDDGDYDDLYIDTVYVDSENSYKGDRQCKIKVINYLKYDENDMMHVVNYRLGEVNENDTE